MLIERECENLINGNRVFFEFLQEERCPMCHASIIAKDIRTVIYAKSRAVHATVLNFCSGCQSCFINTYKATSVKDRSNLFRADILLSSEPVRFVAEEFSCNLSGISPSFVEIYNQAKQAETLSMNHISGIGFRKALEFLVKDYAIHFNPDKEETIKSMQLMQCINTYINNPKIKTLAERSAWLGNDEAHYVRKHVDKDVEDLKRFIKACISYIDMELTLEEAETIPKL